MVNNFIKQNLLKANFHPHNTTFQVNINLSIIPFTVTYFIAIKKHRLLINQNEI